MVSSQHVCTPNRHLRHSGERNGGVKENKVSFGRAMMQALYGCYSWQKDI